MAEILPFYNANELRKIERLESELEEAKKRISKLLDSLDDAQTVGDIWCNAHEKVERDMRLQAEEAEYEIKLLIEDVAHGHQRVKFVQRENKQLREKLEAVEAELKAQKKKYELAMTWWRYEGAD